MITMQDINLAEKRVLIREDLNVPLKNGEITDDTRIRAALPTIREALDANARVILVSHLGRPAEGEFDEAFSLAPVAVRLSLLFGKEVTLVKNWIDGFEIEPGEIVLCENVRFEVGEKANDDSLARKMARLCDVYVNDAFATAHRAHASTHGIAKYAGSVCAGPLLAAELEALQKALADPARPVIAIVGGSKVSTKLQLLESLSGVVDHLIVGGGIANTFIRAAGYNVGQSLCEEDLVEVAGKLMASARAAGGEIPVPTDVVCATEFSENAEAVVKKIGDIGEGDMIMDVGPETAADFARRLEEAGTIVWNGPLGVFEFDQFAKGTATIAHAIASSDAFSIAGGGDTLAAIAKSGVSNDISYISTGGGAFLELLEGKALPAVSILEERERARPDARHPSEGD